MALYKIADLTVDIRCDENKYLNRLCSSYLAEDQAAKSDFSVFPLVEDIEKDKAALDNNRYTDEYLESLSVYRQIARKILDFNGIIFHASVVEMDGISYAFAAPSGTGKSTHCRLWLDAFGEKARIINGDKPLLRYIDGKLYAYGTPWCGKENYNVNTRSELFAICFLERSPLNSIIQIDKNTAVKKLFPQLLMPENEKQSEGFFNMLSIICDNIKFYSLHCNMEKEAAFVAYNGMKER